MERNKISRRAFIKGAAAGTASAALLTLLPKNVLAEEAEEPETQAAESETDALDREIYCIDRFVTNPGEGKEFLQYFMDGYLEKAQSYGMTLKSTMISPPVWLDNAENTIEIVWSIAGFNGWAAMVNASRYDSETLAWWREIRSKVVSQDRSFYALEQDMEVINNV